MVWVWIFITVVYEFRQILFYVNKKNRSKLQNYSAKEVKRIDIFRVVDTLLEMRISCKRKQESLNIDTGSHLPVNERWEWHIALFK